MSLRAASSLALLVAALFVPTVASAETFHIDPESGSPDGDGSQTDPWKTLEDVVDSGKISTRDWNEHPYNEDRTLEPVNPNAPVGPGDTLVLHGGYHGEVAIEGAYNERPIVIRAAKGESPKLGRLLLRAVENWEVRGLTVSPSFAEEYDRQTMISVDNHSWRGPSADVVIADNEVYSVDDASDWSADDWDSKSASGIGVDGDDVEVRQNVVRNVNFGISVGGEDALVARNTVDGFAGDGLRGLGDNGVFEYNVIKNAYDVNKNHDDGFQSWSTDSDGNVGEGEVTGIVLRGNLIINHEQPDHPFAATLQGIGCFDGMFVDWRVVNNVIITDHWHGITLLGSRNSEIVNNTVIDINDSDPGPPWIKIDAHKDGTPSENVVIRNNIAASIQASDGVSADHNLEVDDPSSHFVDPEGFDLHLLETSAAVDGGTGMLAPPVDRDEIPRPQGPAVDLGAFEWHDGPIMTSDTGTMMPDAGADSGDTGRPDSDGDTDATVSTDAMATNSPDTQTGSADAKDGSSSSPTRSDGCQCGTSGGAPRFPVEFAGLALFVLACRSRRR